MSTSQPKPPGTVRPSQRRPAVRKNRRLIFGVIAVLILAAAGFFTYRLWPPSLPAVPDVDLTGADPAVVEAVNQARANLAKNHRSARAWGELGMVLDAHRFTEQAIVCYQAAASLDPNNHLWPFLQGYLRAEGPQREKAVPLYRKAAALSPRSLARVRLAELLVDLNRLDEARRELDTFVKDHPESEFGIYVQARLAQAERDYPKALGFLQRLESSPYLRARALALRAQFHSMLGDQAAADAERNALLKVPPDRPWPDEELREVSKRRVGITALFAEASKLRAQKKPAEALAILRQTTAAYPQSHLAWYYLALVLEEEKDHAEAHKAISRAIELRPGESLYFHHLGLIQQAAGQPTLASAAFRKAIELRPSDWESRLQLGKLLEAQRQYAEAAEVYRQILEYHPEIQEARTALKNLEEKVPKR